MRLREELDMPGSGSQGVVDHVGHRSLQRIADIAKALDENRSPGRDLLFPRGTRAGHVVPMATRGSRGPS